MAKRIVLLSDGTGNGSSKVVKTNVWRLFQALDQRDAQQIARYDDGVGSSSNRYLAIVGGAFGWGLKRNVLDLYQFVCRNWEPGDQIYGFGFSRGAFTIRVLVDLVADQGLVTFQSEEELLRNIRTAYRRYRINKFSPGSWLVRGLRAARDGVLALVDRLQGHRPWTKVEQDTEAKGRHKVRIDFLGLWDTVEAYGVPVAALKDGINRWLWPMVFGDMKLSPKVDRACHALSLDDERTTFHPLLWDEEEEARLAAQTPSQVTPGRITQVWFAGVHANVGGGYGEDQLSLIPLDWIMTEAMAHGLALLPEAVEVVRREASPYARRHDSRAGLAAYYRYGPRVLPEIHDAQRRPILPIIHHSVVLRMAFGSDRYAPIVLPKAFWVLAPSGELLPMQSAGPELSLDASKLRQASVAHAGARPESCEQAQLPVKDVDAQVREAMGGISRPQAEALRLIQDIAFLRRGAYFATLGFSLMLLAYPWVAELLDVFHRSLSDVSPWGGHGLSPQHLQAWNQSASGLIEPVVQALGSLLPGYAGPWITALRQHPLEVAILAGLIGLSLLYGRVQESHIHERAWAGWHAEERVGLNAQTRDRQRWRRMAMSAVVALSGLMFAWLVLTGRAADGWRDATGVVFLGGLAYLLLRRASGAPTQGVSSTFGWGLGLGLARWARSRAWLKTLSQWLFSGILPGLLVMVLVAGGLLVLHRGAFDAASAAGKICTGRGEAGVSLSLDDPGPRSAPGGSFATRDACWATGFRLDEGRLYRLTLTIPGTGALEEPADWFDLHLRADLAGLVEPPGSLQSLFLLKRHWGVAWFQPIARVGVLGNDERPLALSADVVPQAYPAGGDASRPPVWQRPISDAAALAAVERAATPADQRSLTVELRPRSSGELFLFVNDAVVAWPGLTDLFYRNNHGRAELTLERLSEGPRRLE